MPKKKREPTFEERKVLLLADFDARIADQKGRCAMSKHDIITFLRGLRRETELHIESIMESGDSVAPVDLMERDGSLSEISEQMKKCIQINEGWRREFFRLERMEREKNVAEYCFDMMEEDAKSSD